VTAPGISNAIERGLQTYEDALNRLPEEKREELKEAANERARELQDDPLIKDILSNRIEIIPAKFNI
jgi:adenylate kinase